MKKKKSLKVAEPEGAAPADTEQEHAAVARPHEDVAQRLAERGSEVPVDPISESREALKQPLQAGQAFFESPEGYIQVGEAKNSSMWCPQADGGRGAWINRMR